MQVPPLGEHASVYAAYSKALGPILLITVSVNENRIAAGKAPWPYAEGVLLVERAASPFRHVVYEYGSGDPSRGAPTYDEIAEYDVSWAVADWAAAQLRADLASTAEPMPTLVAVPSQRVVELTLQGVLREPMRQAASQLHSTSVAAFLRRAMTLPQLVVRAQHPALSDAD